MIYMLCCDRDPFAAHRHQMRSLFGSFGMDPFPLTPQIQHPRTRIQVRATKTGPVWTVISENDTESVHIFSPTLYSHKLEPWPPLAWWEWYDTVPCSPFCSDSLCILCFNGNKYILSVCTKKLTNLISGRNGAVSKKKFMWVRFCFVFFRVEVSWICSAWWVGWWRTWWVSWQPQFRNIETLVFNNKNKASVCWLQGCIIVCSFWTGVSADCGFQAATLLISHWNN